MQIQTKTIDIDRSTRVKHFAIAAISIVLTLAILACSDDENPIQANDPPKVDSTDTTIVDTTKVDTTKSDTTAIDTIRIDSIDAETICPPQLLRVYGQNLPNNLAEVELSIGGIRATVNSISGGTLMTVVPWDINDGLIRLRHVPTDQVAEFRADLTAGCMRQRPKPFKITSLLSEQFCPCESIVLEINDAEYPNNLRASLGGRALQFPSIDRTSSRMSWIVPNGTEAGMLLISDSDGKEFFRSDSPVKRKKQCLPDIQFELEGIECEYLSTTHRFRQNGQIDTVEEFVTRTIEISFSPSCFFPPTESTYHLFDRVGDTLFVENQKFTAPHTSDSYRLKIAYAMDSDEVRSIEYAHEHLAFSPNFFRRSSTRRVHITVGASSGGATSLKGRDLIERIIFENSSTYQEFNSGAFTTVSTAIPGTCSALANANLHVQLEKP